MVVELANQQTAAGALGVDPLFGSAWAAAGIPRRMRSWSLTAINGMAALAIIAAVAYRLARAHAPAGLLRDELVLFAAGVVLAAVAVAFRASSSAERPGIQVGLMIASAVLADLVLAVAGRTLGDDLQIGRAHV